MDFQSARGRFSRTMGQRVQGQVACQPKARRNWIEGSGARGQATTRESLQRVKVSDQGRVY